MKDRYQLAIDIARKAGAMAQNWLADLKSGAITIEQKGELDFVTRADRDVEAFIRSTILEHFPTDSILGEEHDDHSGDGAFTWVVDPIDGTANYIRDLDNWCISIAVVAGGTCEIAVIFDPSRGALYHAQLGHGAYLNGELLSSAKRDEKKPLNPMVILGHSRRLPMSLYFDTIAHLYARQVDHRRLGSAAISLALVAEGKADGYFEADLNPWDCMAGLLLVQEVGCTILSGQQMARTLKNAPILVGHPCIAEVLQPLTSLTPDKYQT